MSSPFFTKLQSRVSNFFLAFCRNLNGIAGPDPTGEVVESLTPQNILQMAR